MDDSAARPLFIYIASQRSNFAETLGPGRVGGSDDGSRLKEHGEILHASETESSSINVEMMTLKTQIAETKAGG